MVSASGRFDPQRGACLTLSTSESPNVAVVSSLSAILETGPHLQRYCLSPKAARGILRRAAARGRELPVELQQALEMVALSAPSKPAAVTVATASTPKLQQEAS